MVDWVPLTEVLPGCAGLVHHGGAGTVLAALSAGVPQLVVNGPGDRRHNAALVAGCGAGLAVDRSGLTATALTTLITDVGLARTAAEVGAEIERMPAPDQLVPRLVDLVTG